MKAVFADAFYYFALANPKDSSHTRAFRFSEQFTGTVVTTQLVLIEVADGLARPARLVSRTT